MRVAFRVDASTHIGTGHVVRCLTLAQALRERGAECFFVHRLHPGHLSELIGQEGYAVRELPAPAKVADIEGEAEYAAWLGVEPAVDARETVEAIGRDSVDWLVVDHYALAADWERTVCFRARRMAALDDLANRHHYCDLLIDQNRIPDPQRRYDGLVPDQTHRLCGPRYALIRPEYSRAREVIGPRRGPLSRVLVFYGGADIHNESGRALRVLSRPEFRHLAVDVVVGANHPNRQSILNQAKERSGTEVHGPRERLVDLMIEADLALGAGGATTWERCALGLPSVVTAVAINQIPFSQALAMDGAVRFLGHWSDISDECLAGALTEYLDDPSRLAEMGQRAWAVTDGLGRWRVAEAVVPSAREDLQLRRARRTDKPLYFEWANDPTTRAHANNPDPISWATHDQWFNERIEDPNAYLWVMITADGLPVGQIRAEVKGLEAIIGYSIDSAFRGRGWGTRLLELAALAWQREGNSSQLTGEVNTRNEASCRAFIRAGFEESKSTSNKQRRFVLSST